MTVVPSFPTSTYRLQFSHKFRFVDATAILPYLAQLGIDTLYASPYFQARPGSEHGYDVIDHTAINTEVGTPGEHSAMIELSQQLGIAHLIDFVPNHMGIGSVNPWWRDVLMWGEKSPYAEYFDINWQTLKPEGRGRVLLPQLGDLYGVILERGELTLDYLEPSNEFIIRYFESTYPLRLSTYADILEIVAEHPRIHEAELHDALMRLVENLRVHGDDREKAEFLLTDLRELFALPPFRLALTQTLPRLQATPEQPHRIDWLHELLSKQYYRLTYWRVARDEINYRRFFDVNDLAGLRVENTEVLFATHRLVFEWIASGRIQGLRIDHVDGLRHPATYCRVLRGQAEAAGRELYLVVEKILARYESLSDGWQVDGTTGYDFSGMLIALNVDATAKDRFMRIYRKFSGLERDYRSVTQEAKRLVMRTMLASELGVLALLLERVASSDRRSIDFSFMVLRDALTEVVASFPVYRTYIMDGEPSEKDVEYIEWAVRAAKKIVGPQDEQVFDFIFDVLTLRVLSRGRDNSYNPEAVMNFVQKFQQYTSPVMAKSVEDTLFYRYVPLLSLNEVGSDPSRFGAGVNDFHRFNSDRAARFPHSLSATATHDHKRGEDVRTRLNVLSEIPDIWRRALAAFSRYATRFKTMVNDVPAPSANDEYAIYQTLLGTWPCDWLNGVPAEAEQREHYAQRLENYFTKFLREAKLRSSWMNVDENYERATFEFIRRLLDPARSALFQRSFLPLARQTARIGMVSSLVQLALKHTAPGVPDCYQGCELWDLTLVDPDNRTPVDFALRRQILNECAAALETRGVAEYAAELLTHWHDGRIKFFVLWQLLQLRKRYRDTLSSNDYRPLKVTGRRARHIVAFARGTLIIVTPRLLRRLLGEGTQVVCNEGSVLIPKAAAAYVDVVTGERYEVERDQLKLGNLFRIVPFAILEPAAPE